jgi:hypothetical protein
MPNINLMHTKSLFELTYFLAYIYMPSINLMHTKSLFELTCFLAYIYKTAYENK